MRPSNKYFYKGHKKDRHLENMRRPCEVETGRIWKQAKELLEPPEAVGNEEGSSPRAFGRAQSS